LSRTGLEVFSWKTRKAFVGYGRCKNENVFDEGVHLHWQKKSSVVFQKKIHSLDFLLSFFIKILSEAIPWIPMKNNIIHPKKDINK